jgi:hypothetical protein
MTVPDSALPLLASAPSRFTAARAELAQALSARGAPEAAAVRKLRRPVGLAWVMNRLARDHETELEGLLEAADRLREGQRRAVAGGGSAALRSAGEALGARSRALRELAAGVLEAEGLRPDPGRLARLELLLRAAASSHREVRDALRRGALLREPEIAGELSGLALVPGGAGGADPPARAREGEPAGRKEQAARQREEERERRARERKRARAVARAEKEDRAARAAEAVARRAAEVARRTAERAAALRARAERAHAEAGEGGTTGPGAPKGPAVGSRRSRP